MKKTTETSCPNCALMAVAQQKLHAQVIQLRDKLDRILLTMYEVFEEGDAIDWRERKTKEGS
jgi:hypothetical protein